MTTEDNNRKHVFSEAPVLWIKTTARELVFHSRFISQDRRQQ